MEAAGCLECGSVANMGVDRAAIGPGESEVSACSQRRAWLAGDRANLVAKRRGIAQVQKCRAQECGNLFVSVAPSIGPDLGTTRHDRVHASKCEEDYDKCQQRHRRRTFLKKVDFVVIMYLV